MMKVPRISWRQLVLKTRPSGSLATSLDSMTLVKAGVSISLRRT